MKVTEPPKEDEILNEFDLGKKGEEVPDSDDDDLEGGSVEGIPSPKIPPKSPSKASQISSCLTVGAKRRPG